MVGAVTVEVRATFQELTLDVYKIKVGEHAKTQITVANFEADTLRRPPYYQILAPGKESHYAVCPGCENPIQVIGLYKNLESTPNPYGRHYGQSITGLALYDQESYQFCPYSNPERSPDRAGRRNNKEGLPQKILDLLISNFDSIIYMLEQSTGIGISVSLAEKMLISYKGEEGHLYKAAT